MRVLTQGGLSLKRNITLGVSLVLLTSLWSEPSLSSSTSDLISTKSSFNRKFSILQENFPPPLEVSLRLVLRLSERRVYLYQNQQIIISYPVAVGRSGWETPTGEYQVLQKISDPVWQHPFTGEIVPPGPENPLGSHWIGFWTDGTNYIGFHGTPNEETVGQAISHGCVRMFNQDVLALFEKVKVGTPVIIEP
jgi:lipoprotein-anchoring transpeptidase ErfK/SrfK